MIFIDLYSGRLRYRITNEKRNMSLLQGIVASCWALYISVGRKLKGQNCQEFSKFEEKTQCN